MIAHGPPAPDAPTTGATGARPGATRSDEARARARAIVAEARRATPPPPGRHRLTTDHLGAGRRWRLGLRSKLLLTILLVSASSMVIAGVLADVVQERRMEQTQARRIEHIAEDLRAGVLHFMGERRNVQHFFEEFGQSTPDARAAIVGNDGSILFKSEAVWREPFEVTRKWPAYDGPILRDREDGDDPRTTLTMALPAEGPCAQCHKAGSEPIGWLHVSLNRAAVREAVSMVRQSMVLAAVATLVLLAGAGWLFLTLFVVRPAQRLASSMRQAQDGRLDVRTPATTLGPPDEIGTLARRFNSMIASMAELQNEVETTYQRRLDQAEHFAHVGALASSLAHEIKNPLAGLSGAAQVLARDFGADGKKRDVFVEMQRQIARLDRTVSQVLQFSRPRPAQLDPVDVGPVLASTATFLRNLQAAEGIDVRVVEHGDVTVLADIDQLEQVLLNLCLNAVQALEHTGILALAARRDGDHVVIEVADSGPGIPEAIRGEVFKPFFTTKTTGTGLGLAICARIVADHGGQIEVECPAEGGTCFSVRLRGA